MEKMNLYIIINNPDFYKAYKKISGFSHTALKLYTENQEINRINKKIYLKNSIPEGQGLWGILSR